MSGQRADRVADRIRRALAPMIQEELRDPRIGFVTLTEVKLSPDLRHARAFVTVMGQEPEGAIEALNHAVPFLRRNLAREAGLRFTPQIRFEVDEAEASGQRVDRLLDRIREERHEDEG